MAASQGEQLNVLCERYLEIVFSDRGNTLLLLLQAPLIAFFIVLTWRDVDIATDSLYYVMTLTALWFGTFNSCREVVKEGAILDREARLGVKPGPYLLSKLLVLALVSFIQCLCLCFIVNRSIALGGCRDVLVTGNMITMGNGGAGIGTETTVHHVVISNNIIDMNGRGRQGGSGIGIASDDSSFVTITGNQVFGGHPDSVCLHVATVQHGVVSNNLLRVSKGKVNGSEFGGCGIRIGRTSSPHDWHLLVSGNRIHSPITRNVGIHLVAGGADSVKSHIQLLNNTIDGFQFAISMDRQSGGRYSDVAIRGNTSTRSPLVGKQSSADRRVVIEGNSEPVR